MTKAAIDKYKLGMLQLMLKDPKIKECIVMDGSYAGEVRVMKNGDLLLGRTKYGWINKVFNQYDKIDFFTLANKIAVIITDRNESGGNPNDLQKMVWEIVDKEKKKKDRESVIELLFYYLVLMCASSPFKSRQINVDDPTLKKNRVKTHTHIVGKATAYGELNGLELPIDIEFSND